MKITSKIILTGALLLTLVVGVKLVAASEITGNLGTLLTTGIEGVVKAAPTPSPAAGTYTSAQSVSLTASGSTAICYTTSGTTPACATSTTCTTGSVYGSAVSISATTTLKAAGCYGDNSTGPVLSATYTISSGGGGGGGGGGSSATYCSSVTYSAWASTCFGAIQSRSVTSSSPSGCTLTTAQQVATQRTCPTGTPVTPTEPPVTPTTPTTPTTPGADVVSLITQETTLVFGQTNPESYFINAGTASTLKLGAGERGAAVSSFKEAYGRAPKTEADWRDVLNIANGRWPLGVVKAVEARAYINFKLVYGRNANMKNSTDVNALKMMGYGVRSTKARDLKAEASAIARFKATFGFGPTIARHWNIIRAIAYSGVVK